MGMFDTLYANIFDTKYAIQIKDSNCLLKDYYWLDKVPLIDEQRRGEDRASHCLTIIEKVWPLEKYGGREFFVSFIFIKGILVDYCASVEKKDIKTLTDNLKTIWSDPYLQKEVLDTKINIEIDNSENLAHRAQKFKSLLQDYAYLTDNRDRVREYLKNKKNNIPMKINILDSWPILTNSLVDIQKLKIKNFNKTVNELLSCGAQPKKNIQENIEELGNTHPMCISLDSSCLSNSAQNREAMPGESKKYQYMQQLIEKIKAWSLNKALVEPQMLVQLASSHLIRHTIADLLEDRLSSAAIKVGQRTYKSYAQFLLNTGSNISRVRSLLDTTGFNELVLNNLALFLYVPNWSSLVFEPELLKNKKNVVKIIKELNRQKNNNNLSLEAYIENLITLHSKAQVCNIYIDRVNLYALLLLATIEKIGTSTNLLPSAALNSSLTVLQNYMAGQPRACLTTDPSIETQLVEKMKTTPELNCLYAIYEKMKLQTAIVGDTKGHNNKIKI